jgi:hypothetical protein
MIEGRSSSFGSAVTHRTDRVEFPQDLKTTLSKLDTLYPPMRLKASPHNEVEAPTKSSYRMSREMVSDLEWPATWYTSLLWIREKTKIPDSKISKTVFLWIRYPTRPRHRVCIPCKRSYRTGVLRLGRWSQRLREAKQREGTSLDAENARECTGTPNTIATSLELSDDEF